jgi:MBG domain (YGX type)
MKNITLRTKITLTIVGLLACTGTFYAANPTSFAPVHNGGPVGVAAAPDLLLATEYCSQNLDTIDCAGNVTTLATIPGTVGQCLEKLLTIAPSQSTNAGFTPRDIFVTEGGEVYKISGGVVSPFATIPDAPADHTGITFDHVGTFGYNMIVTTSDDNNLTNGGKVYEVDSTGSPTLIADTGFQTIKGPAVVPSAFGTYGGQLLVADDFNGAVHAIDGSGNVTYDVFDWSGAGAIVVIPSATCAFCNDTSNPGVYFQAIENLAAVYQYPPTDFTGSGGSILVASTSGAGSNLITWDGSKYNGNFFDKIAGTYEGSAWTDCDVPPLPTPSPSPTANPSATPTPTQTNLSVSAATGTYGGTTTFSATLTQASDNTSVAGKTINFTLNGNPAGSGVTDANGVATSSSVLLYGSSYTAGVYPMGAAASFAGDLSLGASNGTNSLTVSKAKLLVSADSKARLYGNPNPPLTAKYTGFVQTDTLATSGVTGQPTLTTTATQFSPVGKYPIIITQGALTAGSNYDVTFVDGTLTVYLSGIIGLQKITIGASSALVDSYDSSIGYPTSQSQDATLLSNGTITLQGAKIYGDMISAQGNVILQANSLVTGDVTYATTLSLANSATILGTITHQASTPIVAPIPDACGSYTKAPTTWITGAYTYDGTKGNLTVSGGGTATLASGTYCFNNVTVSGGSTLIIGGTVMINVTGKFTDSGGSLQNPSAIPFNLQVASSYTGSNGVTVSGTSATYLSIYAPGTDLTVSGGGPLYGALVCKALTVSGNSFVHEDLALPDIWSVFGP